MSVQQQSTAFQLFDPDGGRKYLTANERRAALRAVLDDSAMEGVPDTRWTLLATLAYSGCRLSEALALTTDRVDLEQSMLVFETMKKRRRGIYRAVPVPEDFLGTLDMVHSIRAAHYNADHTRLWTLHRATAWRHVKNAMISAGIDGPQACPKGFRHGFGVQAVSSGVPLNLVSRWLGHSCLEVTAIYADAVGDEQRRIMARMWEGEEIGSPPGPRLWPAEPGESPQRYH